MELKKRTNGANPTFAGRALIVDDDPVTCELLVVELHGIGFETDCVRSLNELRERVRQRSYDFVLLDLFLENEEGLEALPFLVKEAPYTKVIMMSAHGTVALAVDALDRGASTFIAKSKNPHDIVKVIQEKFLLPQVHTDALPKEVRHGIIGTSLPIRKVIKLIHQIRDVDSTVLVEGESGTGKELVARAVHQNSLRSRGRFEAINCGAIPETLLESELFGHKKGAFTDASMDRKGLFETCSNGTLFLDEIGDMPLNLQVKLNRALQEHEIMPLGSSQTIAIETRVIAATNKTLLHEVSAGRFREDLYYRLAVLRIDLPSLRQRREDIPLLVNYFLQLFNSRFSKQVRPPSKELELRLSSFDWPGNVRQLQNAVERGVILTKDFDLHLEDMLTFDEKGRDFQTPTSQPDFWNKPLSEAKQGFERDYLKHLLGVTRGNISEIARMSGRYRADIYRLFSKYGIEWEEFRN